MRRLAAALLAALLAPAAPAQALHVASWNLQWLAEPAALDSAHYWGRCALDAAASAPGLPPCDAWRRSDIDTGSAYAARKLAPLREALAALAADGVQVLALQEVQNAAALQAVLPAGFRVACMTRRPSAQNLAFAVRDTPGADAGCAELPALALEDAPVPHALRRGLALTLQRGGRRVVLLNLHLKAGCARASARSAGLPSCHTLQQQLLVLRRWAEAQAAEGTAFAILGDWNFDAERRLGWPLLRVVPADRHEARRRACHRDIDHLALGGAAWGAEATARLLPAVRAASDHCALRADLVLP